VSTQFIERMAVEIEGRGDPVILIHGLGGTSNTFTPQMGVFAERFRTVRPDLPGSGRSPVSATLAMQLFVDTLIRMSEVLGVERAHWVGHSLGTIVCQQIAVQRPRLVRSLALLGPLLEPPEPARKGLRDRAARARAEGMADIANAIVQAGTSADTRRNQPVAVAFVRESLMRQPPEGYALTCEALAGATAAEVQRIGCPTLLVTGDEDAVAPPSVARATGERIEGARVEVLGRCGHWTPIERAAEVNRLLVDFYRGEFHARHR
jgi:pimeloyl-ACP methyl ester carboxylesterase